MKKRIIIICLVLLCGTFLVWKGFCRQSNKKGLFLVSKVSESKSKPTGLIIVTHGWIHKGKGRWPERMAKAISEKVDTDKWLVGYFDWGKGSATINPLEAVTYARDIAGAALAGQVLKLDMDFEHIHFIGHSCGSWVISEAIKILEPFSMLMCRTTGTRASLEILTARMM